MKRVRGGRAAGTHVGGRKTRRDTSLEGRGQGKEACMARNVDAATRGSTRLIDHVKYAAVMRLAPRKHRPRRSHLHPRPPPCLPPHRPQSSGPMISAPRATSTDGQRLRYASRECCRQTRYVLGVCTTRLALTHLSPDRRRAYRARSQARTRQQLRRARADVRGASCCPRTL